MLTVDWRSGSCFNSAFQVGYESDNGTGKARLPPSLFCLLNIRLGWILELRLDIHGHLLRVLCSAWPLNNTLDGETTIILDPSVIHESTKRISWQQGTYKVIFIHQPRMLSSLRLQSVGQAKANQSNKELLATIIQMAVCPGYIITTNEAKRRPIDMLVTAANTSGIVSIGTLLTTVTAGNLTPNASFSNTTIVDKLTQVLITPIVHNQPMQARLRGILLHGPPGTGKTYAVKALQHTVRSVCEVAIFSINITELLAMGAAEALKSMKTTFKLAMDRASKASATTTASQVSTPASQKSYSYQRKSLSPEPTAPSGTPSFRFTSPGTPIKAASPNAAVVADKSSLSVLLVDEVDALGSGAEASDTHVAIKQLLCSWLDGVTETSPSWCIVATSNRPNAVDKSLRRGGRLELELEVMASSDSSMKDRALLLTAILTQLSMALSITIDAPSVAERIAISTGGYVAADLVALHREVIRSLSTNLTLADSGLEDILVACYLNASKSITPSSLRGATISLPNLSFSDVVGHAEVKQSLLRLLAFYDPSKRLLLERFNLKSPGGALLYGPPGNSKTRLVLACASSMQLPVISLSVADIYSPYLGDAEAEIRRVFSLARQSSPCILFLDEIDAVVTDRNIEASSTGAESRVLATILLEMDGLNCNSSADGVFILGATNRIDAIDAALLRKGRFHHLLHVKCPTANERILILEYFCKAFNLSDESSQTLRMRSVFQDRVDYTLSGAEIEGMCREEAMIMLRLRLQSFRGREEV